MVLFKVIILFLKWIWYCLLYPFKNNLPNNNNNNNNNKKYIKLIKQNDLYEYGVKFGGNNVVTRQLNKTCHELYEFDKNTELNKKSIKLSKGQYFNCYGCMKCANSMHPVYVFSCKKCGQLFQQNRNLTRNLKNHVALVTGSRTKLGHQITLKMLRAGAIVIGTTRFPTKAMEIYEKYSDFNEWKDSLIIYPKSIDFDKPDMIQMIAELYNFIDQEYGKLDVLVNCAAQTIRVREKEKKMDIDKTNRYGDAQFVQEKSINSWQMKLEDLIQTEMEEVYRINAIAPCLMIQSLISLLKKSKVNPYIINVHAREGLIDVGHKNPNHIHLNMAKSGMSMLTRSLIDCKFKTDDGKQIYINGCDPGWISVDEYYEKNRPWVVPPLDEIDGASRVLYPLFTKLNSSRKTRRHYNLLSY